MIHPVEVCGLKVYPLVGVEQLLHFIAGQRTLLIAIGAEKLLSTDQSFRTIVNEGVGYADGIGTVWALGRKGYDVPKIRGADLWLRVVHEFKHRSIYIVGAEKDVLRTAVKKLSDQFEAQIVGARDGFFDDDGFAALRQDVVDKQPHIVFVAMGSPRQEFVMAELSKVYPALYMGIGGSLDLYVGKVPSVPEWWTRLFKWEGLYRQVYDLKNIKRWRRQIRVLPIVWRILTNRI